MSWKKTILTVEKFIDNRPDMALHNEGAVQSAIFQAAGLLDSETNGLLGKVWNFNYLDPNFAPDSNLKRSEWELEQCVEAMIVQTQYMLNMGNDLSQGGGSYSIGNINSSWSRPENRDIVAPGVFKLLQNARVYNLQSFGGWNNECDTECNCYTDKYSQEPITRAIGDGRYVKVDQGKPAAGNVAVVGENGLVSFANPNDLNFSNFSATRIKDWLNNDYVYIDKVTNQLFRGQDLYGVHSGVERGELYNLLALTYLDWQPNFPYKKGQIINYIQKADKTLAKMFNVKENTWILLTFVSLRDNINKEPPFNPEDWKQLGTVSTDINEIVNLVYDRVVKKYDSEFQTFKLEIQDIQNAFEGRISQQFSDFVNEINNKFANLEQELKDTTIPQEVAKQLNELPTIENIIFHKNIWYGFETKGKFETDVKDKFNLKENTDYTVMRSDRYILSGNDGAIGGDNICKYTLKQSDLPDVQYRTYHYNQYLPQYNAWISEVLKGNANSISYQRLNDNLRGNGNTNGGTATSSAAWYTFNLNGGVSQTPISFTIIPQYKEVYFVKFLKDIVQKGVVVQGVGSTYTGQTPIVVDNNTNTISLETSFVDKVNNFDDTNYAKLNQKNEYSQDNYYGSESEKHIWIAKPFSWSGNTYSSIKFRNGEKNILTFECNYDTQESFILSNVNKLNINGLLDPKNEQDATNKRYVDKLVANATPQDYNNVKAQVETNKNDIANLKTKDTQLQSAIDNNALINTTQTQKLNDLEAQIQTLLQDQANDMSYVGAISDSGTYKNGDYGFKNDGFWYVYDNGAWKKINQQISVDLSNYYTIPQVDNLLSQKVSNDTYTQDKETLANRLSTIETKNQEQDTLLDKKADKDNFSQSINVKDIKVKNSNNSLYGYGNDEVILESTKKVCLIAKEANNRIFVNETNAYVQVNNKSRVIASENFVNDALATKQDTLTAGSGISIENNVISQIGTPNQIRWYEGQVLYFETKEKWEILATKYNLQENVDYKIGSVGKYIKIGENGATGGSGIVTIDNIKSFSVSGNTNSNGNHSHTFYLPRGDKNYNNGSGNVLWGGSYNWAKTTSSAGSHYHSFSLNIGASSPTPLDLPYIERYEVVILRDI